MPYSRKTAHMLDAAPIGTERLHPTGYLMRKVTTGPKGWKKVHRLVMEEKLGRSLLPDEIVHHINHDKLDNRIENLEIMTAAEHSHHHNKDKIPPGGYKIPEGRWSHKYEACVQCGTTETPHWGKGYCKPCYFKVYITSYRERSGYYDDKKEYFRNRRQQTHLSSGKWAMQYDACIECGTTERRHVGHGLCNACDTKRRYRAKKHTE